MTGYARLSGAIIHVGPERERGVTSSSYGIGLTILLNGIE